MRKGSVAALVVLMCVALGIGSAAQASGDSVKMLGAREIALPEGSEYIMKFNANGVGESFMGGERAGFLSSRAARPWPGPCWMRTAR